VEKDSDRDYWMIAEEAKAYGMIDELLVKNKSKDLRYAARFHPG
jgi:ATP-dependent Clp protease protease subunit